MRAPLLDGAGEVAAPRGGGDCGPDDGGRGGIAGDDDAGAPRGHGEEGGAAAPPPPPRTRWVVAQYSLSVPLPNEVALEVAALVQRHERKSEEEEGLFEGAGGNGQGHS